ncbi:MAG: peptide chain release factor N(5)-glutamine methyltransferase [Atribacterota bacterium]|nr:peptide chain release factor N(5)-glutamine methyltransferase [Atribacterota bacterium]
MDKKISAILKEGEIRLTKSGNNRAAEESILLLSYLLNKSRFNILFNRSLSLSPKDIQTYYDWIDSRSKGMPLQYITGFQNFMGLEFKVEKGIFIPRPETEILVEKIINIISLMPDKVELCFLDVGTGSGIIPVTICNHFQNSRKNIHFYAVDISAKAIILATENAHRLKCAEKITFCHGNMFDCIKNLNREILFDGIISNPPYIPREELDNLPDEIYYHEPVKALDGGEKGLDYYQEIISKTPQFLKQEKSFLAFEIGHNQQKDISEMIKKSGFFKKYLSVIQDYYHNDRVILAYTK